MEGYWGQCINPKAIIKIGVELTLKKAYYPPRNRTIWLSQSKCMICFEAICSNHIKLLYYQIILINFLMAENNKFY